MSENAAQTGPTAEKVSKTIQYEDFAKLNLRVATILKAGVADAGQEDGPRQSGWLRKKETELYNLRFCGTME